MIKRRKKNDPIDQILDILPGVVIIFLFILWLRTGNLSLVVTIYVIILIITLGTGFYLYRRWRKKLLASGIKQIDVMSGKKFEQFLVEYFRQSGYKGTLTPEKADYGADLLLQKDSIKYVVQAKRWEKTVGIGAVQQVIGAIRHYSADKGMVITNSKFSKNAINLARTNNVELWDRRKLISFLSQADGVNLAEKISHEYSFDPVNKLCQKCGEELVLRDGKRGLFYGCSMFPNCRYTENYIS